MALAILRHLLNAER